MQAYLRYQDPSQIEIFEPNRAALKTAHTYFFSTVSGGGGTINLFVIVTDTAFVSDMGAQVRVNVQVAGSGSSAIIQLTGPDGFLHEWDLIDYLSLGVVVGPDTVFDLQLYAQDFAPKLAADGYTWVRRQVAGAWKLTFKNLDAVNSASLFVEGVGRGPGGRRTWSGSVLSGLWSLMEQKSVQVLTCWALPRRFSG